MITLEKAFEIESIFNNNKIRRISRLGNVILEDCLALVCKDVFDGNISASFFHNGKNGYFFIYENNAVIGILDIDKIKNFTVSKKPKVHTLSVTFDNESFYFFSFHVDSCQIPKALPNNFPQYSGEEYVKIPA